MRKFFIILFLIFYFSPTNAQDITIEEPEILKAEVVKILIEDERLLPGTEVKTNYQRLEARILEGENKGEIVTIENDFIKLEEGEKFYAMKAVPLTISDSVYTVYEKYRLPAVYFFIALFFACVILFGGIQGIRGLASLIGSLFLIIFVLMPGILSGYSPILITIGVSSLIIVLGSYITHGFNRTTSSAIVGMVATVIFTGILAYIAVKWAGLSGFETEEAVFLNWSTKGSIDLVGLLFGGIMIGLLGVLYDVAIGQAISVEELREAGPHMTRSVILKRALRIGREHTGALVNTLAIAYVGAALPLLLLFYGNNTGLDETINREIFSTEIIRMMVGSIGLVIAVPITTFISVWMLVRPESDSH